MQEFLHTNHDDVQGAVERFKQMISTEKEVYFDVHQIESVFEFYVDKNLLDKAAQILHIGLSQHPQASSLQVKKAGILADNGKLEEALEILVGVAPIENTNYEVFITMGWIYLQKGLIDLAMDNFGLAASMAYEDEEGILLEIGYNLNQEEFYLESVLFLEPLVAKYPNNESGLFELAFAKDKLEQTEDSILYYQKVLDVNPFSENAWYNLGIIYNKQENYIEASKAYDFTLAVNPNHCEAYFNKGNSLAHAGHYYEALDFYLEHVSLNVDVILTYQYIADCWEQLGDYKMAIRFYGLVTDAVPNSEDAWYGMASALMEDGDYTEGLSAIEKAIDIDSKNADYWFVKARGCFELGLVDEATSSLESGITIEPDELSAWTELLKLKLIGDANFDLRSFCSEIELQYPELSSVHYLSSIINFKHLADEEKGLSELSLALSLNKLGLITYLEDFPEIAEKSKVRDFLDGLV